MKYVLGVLALTAMVGVAMAHDHGPGSWINNQRLNDPVSKEGCCNLNDCREETDNVAAVDGGFLIISTGEVIAHERVIWRSPGGWWRCRYLGPMLPKRPGDTRCLIGPPFSG